MRAILLFIVLFFLILPSLLASDRRREERPVHVQEVVSILSGDLRTPQECTGFIVAKDIVVTAAHCLSEKVGIKIVGFADGRKEAFQVLKVSDTPSPYTDFAILKVNTAALSAAALERGKVTPLTPTIQFRYSLEDEHQYIMPGMYMLTTDAVWISSIALPGDSGGPVMSAESEKVIGLVTQSLYPIPVTRAVPIERVLAALAELKVKGF